MACKRSAVRFRYSPPKSTVLRRKYSVFLFYSGKKIRGAPLAMQAGQWHPRSPQQQTSPLQVQPGFPWAAWGRADSARTSVAGFGRSASSKATWAAKKQEPRGILQKLNFSDSVSQSEREGIEKELSVIPQWQRDKAESIINKVVMTEKDAAGSGYYYPDKTLYLHPERKSGDVIHEYGHALEISLDLRHNSKYISIRKSGIDVEDFSKIVYDDSTYTQAIYLLQNSKFISEYQGRLYESPTDGIFKAGTMQINEDMLKEYFSEGYRAFYQEPSALKEKDPQLYHFIEGLKDDKK